MRRFAVSTTVLLSAALGALGWAMQFSPISNQILGLMLYIIAGLLALLAIARWQWVVRKRTQYGVTFMSIAIVGLIGAIAGAIIAATLYLLSPYLVEPRDEAKESRARVEFLLEAAKPLKQVALIIDLKQALTPDALEHFRALVTISNMDVSAQYPNPTERDDPHPALCVGGRDHYPVADLGGTKQKWFGVQHLVYALNPSDEMQNTLFSMSQPTSSRIELSGGLYGKGPFKTIGDLDDRYVNVYITEPLLQHIAAIHFVANSYLLFSEPVANVARVNGSPLAKWPGALDSKEQGVPWITLMLKGADYARYETEGESPHWFPFNLYRPWILPFDGYTPGRL